MKGAAGAVAGQLVRLPRIVPFFVLSIPARWRRKLAAALLVAAGLFAGYLLWLRDSSLVAIDKVQVSGLTTRDAPKVREALEAAASDMTTLHVSRERLLEAAAAWPVVNDLRVTTDFPHGVRIEAIERRPVALVTSGGQQVPLSEDGTVIRGLRGAPKLPEVDRRLVAVAGAAPGALLERVKSIRTSDRGLVAELGKGPDIVLGDQGRLRAKWAAAAAVLADKGSEGAEYIDVRLPERPVAGGLPEPEPEPDAAATAEPATPPTPAPAAPQSAPQAASPVAPQPVVPDSQP
jgi:cell division protein FtsQ